MISDLRQEVRSRKANGSQGNPDVYLPDIDDLKNQVADPPALRHLGAITYDCRLFRASRCCMGRHIL